jgi:hypothetical protein
LKSQPTLPEWRRNGQTTGRDPEAQDTKASDGTYLACRAFGEGDQHLLWASGSATHLEVFWEYPPAARFLRRLATFARGIW